MDITVTAEVTYICTLDNDRAELVMRHAKENDMTLEEAVWDLQFNSGDPEMYDDSVESDFSTQSVDCVELTSEEQELYNDIFEEDEEDEGNNESETEST